MIYLGSRISTSSLKISLSVEISAFVMCAEVFILRYPSEMFVKNKSLYRFFVYIRIADAGK
ncbi:hypothetical protein [Campylobacter devanensis]|uniref:hypothetical protein n=1 Tax=Campylobacter devanensis TaxID=3161138 RepID=UPI0015D6E2AE|nr:hypothetical protein [Campylobacter sp. P0134]